MGKSRSATMILAYLLWDSRRRSLASPVPSATSDTAPTAPTADNRLQPLPGEEGRLRGSLAGQGWPAKWARTKNTRARVTFR